MWWILNFRLIYRGTRILYTKRDQRHFLCDHRLDSNVSVCESCCVYFVSFPFLISPGCYCCCCCCSCLLRVLNLRSQTTLTLVRLILVVIVGNLFFTLCIFISFLLPFRGLDDDDAADHHHHYDGSVVVAPLLQFHCGCLFVVHSRCVRVSSSPANGLRIYVNNVLLLAFCAASALTKCQMRELERDFY